jgi:hypothetical protein
VNRALTLHPQGAGRDRKAADALKDSDPLRAEARVESHTATLTLYTRGGCPLCEEMEAAVGSLMNGTGRSLKLIDVDADPSLKTKYGWDVPLLFDGESELCRHQLDLPAFQEWLRAHP